jgi:hypothetical protein
VIDDERLKIKFVKFVILCRFVSVQGWKNISKVIVQQIENDPQDFVCNLVEEFDYKFFQTNLQFVSPLQFFDKFVINPTIRNFMNSKSCKDFFRDCYFAKYPLTSYAFRGEKRHGLGAFIENMARNADNLGKGALGITRKGLPVMSSNAS